MKFNEEELKPWIVAQLEAGYTYDALLWSLVTTQGYALSVAQRIMAACVYHDGHGGVLFRQAPDARVPAPEPFMSDVGVYDVQGQEVTLSFSQLHPHISVFENFVTPQECAELIAYSRSELERSKVAAENPEERIYAGRTSSSYGFLDDELVALTRVRHRLAALLQWPLTHIERPEIIQYLPSQRFEPHNDYFGRSAIRPGAFNAVDRFGNRIATFIVYLQQPRRGGATYFANLGLEVFPKTRGGLFFNYPTCDVDSMTLHGGSPVIEGEKWVMTFFLRERSLQNPEGDELPQA